MCGLVSYTLYLGLGKVGLKSPVLMLVCPAEYTEETENKHVKSSEIKSRFLTVLRVRKHTNRPVAQIELEVLSILSNASSCIFCNVRDWILALYVPGTLLTTELYHQPMPRSTIPALLSQARHCYAAQTGLDLAK